MTYANPDALVSTQWLEDHLSAPDVRIVDASCHLDPARDARKEFAECHIPGAVFFDIDEIADTSSPYPHTLPPAEVFSAKVRKLGLGDGNHVVVYDSNGGAMAAARVWWMFRLFGNHHVSVLNGGLPKWRREGRPVSDEPAMAPRERHFTARMDTTLVRSADEIRKAIENGRFQIVDARAAGRFQGDAPEPRPTKRRGHIPGSRNLPFAELLDPTTATFLPAHEIKTRFADAGIDLKKPLTATCGSGVTACVIALAAYLVGHRDVAVYDGSWAEWGNREDLPVETGDAA